MKNYKNDKFDKIILSLILVTAIVIIIAVINQLKLFYG